MRDFVRVLGLLFNPAFGVLFFFFFECVRFPFSASITMFIIREGIRAWRLLLHPYGTTAVLMFGSYNNQCIRVTAVA